MRTDRTFLVTLIAALAFSGAPAIAQSDSDLEKLQRQREALILQRQKQQKRRTLLEISPQTGKTAAAPTSDSNRTVVSPTPEPTTTARKKKTAKKRPTGSQTAAVAKTPARPVVPASLAPEDQLFRPIEFAYDSAFLSETARETLSGLCATVKVDLDLNPSSKYFVIGHTDAAGSEAYNVRLSQRRADATKQFLVDKCQIESSKLTAVGLGEERLLASAGPRDSQQRRVEIQVNIDDSGS